MVKELELRHEAPCNRQRGDFRVPWIACVFVQSKTIKIYVTASALSNLWSKINFCVWKCISPFWNPPITNAVRAYNPAGSFHFLDFSFEFRYQTRRRVNKQIAAVKADDCHSSRERHF